MLLALEKLRCMFTTCNAGERSLADADILIWTMLMLQQVFCINGANKSKSLTTISEIASPTYRRRNASLVSASTSGML